MQVDLQELKNQLEAEIKSIEQKKAAVMEQLKHVEAVQRIASRLDKPSSPPTQAAAVEVEGETEAPKANGKPAAEDAFEWAFQDKSGNSELVQES